MIKRLFYLGYYLKELDKSKLNKFMDFVSKQTNKSKLDIWLDMIQSSLVYNISLLEYFNFKFYELSKTERKTYAGTGFMYEYQLIMNPKNNRIVLEDKIVFLKDYSKFVNHKFASLIDLKKDRNKALDILNNQSGKVVLKDLQRGSCLQERLPY